MSVEPLKPVPYEPQAGVSRRAFRWLMVLTLLNTVMLGSVVVGPTMTNFVRQQWADYKQRQAAKQAEAAATVVRQAFLPVQQQAMDYVAPAGALIYAEDADGVAQLSAAGPIKNVCSASTINRPKGMTFPAGAADPSMVASFPLNIPSTVALSDGSRVFGRTDLSFVYLHRCQSVAGPRLVAVYVHSDQTMASGNWVHDAGGRYANNELTTRRLLVGIVLDPETPTKDLTIKSDVWLSLNAGGMLVTTDFQGGMKVDAAGQLSLFAGRPDATDAAVFHIPYQLNGHVGTIDGRLYPDDKLTLTPDPYLADLERKIEAQPVEISSPDVRRAVGVPR